jgi:plastocyanin
VHSTRVAMIAFVLPLALAIVTGCGSSKTATSTAPTSGFGTRPATSTTTIATGGSVTTTASTPTAPGQVAIVDYDFSPNSITVNVGDTVTWTNQDTSDHWVVSAPTSPVSFDLGRQATAATVQHTFTAPGSYPYFCNLHNYMKGTVVVR